MKVQTCCPPPRSSPLSDLAVSVKSLKAETTFPLFLPPLIQIFVNISREGKFGMLSERFISFSGSLEWVNKVLLYICLRTV